METPIRRGLALRSILIVLAVSKLGCITGDAGPASDGSTSGASGAGVGGSGVSGTGAASGQASGVGGAGQSVGPSGPGGGSGTGGAGSGTGGVGSVGAGGAAACVDRATQAFPTAEGFGSNTVGGRGGRVIEVTNLDDSGSGSLRDALSQRGPRIVVFRVSGTIELESTLRLTEPFVTIAGQTAPGGGIQLKNESFYLQTHDVIIRHLRVRPGLDAVDLGVGRDLNALTLYGSSLEQPVYNVIVDHSDLMWSTDQNADSYGNTYDTTFQWCIVAEGTTIGHSGNPNAEHSMGSLVGSEPWYGQLQRVTIHHSLYAHNAARNPLACTYPADNESGDGVGTPATLLDFRNNVVYNPRSFAGICAAFYTQSDFDNFPSASGGEPGVVANFVGNQFIQGPDTLGGTVLDMVEVQNYTRFYSADNVTPRCPSGCSGDAVGVDYVSQTYFGGPSEFFQNGTFDTTPFVADEPYAVAPVTTHSSREAYDLVLDQAGATRPARDAVDQRIVSEVRDLSGIIGNRLDYPSLAGGTPPDDSDKDGMPDAWEDAHQLDPSDPSDGSQVACNGWTNVENYLNELAGDPIP